MFVPNIYMTIKQEVGKILKVFDRIQVRFNIIHSSLTTKRL